MIISLPLNSPHTPLEKSCENSLTPALTTLKDFYPCELSELLERNEEEYRFSFPTTYRFIVNNTLKQGIGGGEPAITSRGYTPNIYRLTFQGQPTQSFTSKQDLSLIFFPKGVRIYSKADKLQILKSRQDCPINSYFLKQIETEGNPLRTDYLQEPFIAEPIATLNRAILLLRKDKIVNGKIEREPPLDWPYY